MKRKASLESCPECPAYGDCVFATSDARPHGEQQQMDVVRDGSVTVYKSGEYIIHPGSLSSVAPVICQGLAALLFITEGGDEMLLHALGPGAILGLSDCLQKRTMFSVAAKAVTDVTIRFVTVRQALTLLKRSDAGEVLFHQIGGQLETAQRAGVCMRARSAFARVAIAIHELVRLLRLKGNSYIILPERIPRWYLASYTALSPETVSRSLTELRKEGLIDFRKRRLVITDLANLERMSS